MLVPRRVAYEGLTKTTLVEQNVWLHSEHVKPGVHSGAAIQSVYMTCADIYSTCIMYT